MVKEVVKMISKIISIILCFSIISACALPQSEKMELAAPEAENEFTVKVMSIGKADAIVLKTENHAVLIDTGKRGDGKDILNYLEKKGVEKIDYMFITHYDSDHVGGAVKLINNIDTENIITPKYKGNNSEYKRFIKALSENVKKQQIITEKMSFVLDDVLFEAYPAKQNFYKESDNDFSIVISVTHGENKFLFAGDAEKTRIDELSAQLELEHDFLKVPHHGKLSENSEEFIKNVNPKIAVITDSAEEPCDEEILKILEGIGAEVIKANETDAEFVSDGKNIKF